MAIHEGIIAFVNRTTEAGYVRITEDGNTRIGEQWGPESIVVSDAESIQWAIQGIIAESSVANDALAVITETTILESSGVSDTLLTLWAAQAVVSESCWVSDVLLALWNAQCAISESSSAGDAVLALWNMQCALAESLITSDAYVLTRIYDKTLNESVSVSGSVFISGILAGCWLAIEGNETFEIGDILHIKEGSDAEWMEVTNVTFAPIYRVIRDKAGDYADGSNPEWTKGASVVNYGQSGDGGIYLTASDTNAPHLSIFTHAGEPWNTITTHIREGNLNGYAGYSSDIYGWASYIDANNYIKIDPTNGIRMSGSINITGGSGIAQLSDAGALATQDDVAEGDLQSGVTDRMFLDAATKANIEAWRKAGSPTYMDGACIYAKSITADKFISTLYGDLNQAMDYVKTVLSAGDEYEYDLTATDLSNGGETNGDAGTHFDYGISVRISTAKEWDDGGVWDTEMWDEPTDASGSWTSASMDLGSSATLQLALRYTRVEETSASTTETIKLQYSTDNVNFGANSPTFNDGLWETAAINKITGDIYKATGALSTFRYFKVKIELTTTVTTDRIILHTMTYLGNVVNLFGQEVNKTIANGGTAISLNGFNATPAITVTPVGSTPLVPIITAQSSSSITVKLYNLAGNDVGGHANINLIGV